MPLHSFDRLPWNHPASLRRNAKKQRDPGSDPAVEWEFSDAMRSSRFPAAWFTLPGAALAGVFLLVFLR